jgi:hypothetical protein
VLDHSGPAIDERLRLRARAVVDRQVATVVQQAGGENLAHPADTDPAEGLGIWRRIGHVLTPQ